MAVKQYYLPYLKSGLIPNSTESTTDSQRLSTAVDIRFGSKNGTTRTGSVQVSVRGSGDILGFRENMVTRTQPTANNGNFNASLIPFVEFAAADFLWRYSTRQVGAYWLPWLSLIVLKNAEGDETGEFELLKRTSPDLPPTLKSSNDAILPDLKESWRWAHVHLSDHGERTFSQLKTKIANRPECAVGRLLCPRRLRSGVKYTAFVVPTFELGIQAGLGESLTANVNSLSWETPNDAQNKTLPYYYKWEFRTGKRGDFETLVRQLQFTPLADVGLTPIDASDTGYGIAVEEPILAEGPLKSPGTSFQEWGFDESASGNSTQADLADLLNKRIGEDGEPRVVPPIYGLWYVQQAGKKFELNKRKKWISEINLDFRHRYAAALGAQFVKDNQEQLMQSAWQQLKEVQKANRRMNLGKFGNSITRCLFKRVSSLSDSSLLQISLPVQDKISTNVSFDNDDDDDPRPRSFSPTHSSLRYALRQSDNAGNLNQPKIRKFMVRKFTPPPQAGVSDFTILNIRNDFQPILRQAVVNNNFSIGTPINNQDSTISIQITEPSAVENKLEAIGSDLRKGIDPKQTIANPLNRRVSKIRQWAQAIRPDRGAFTAAVMPPEDDLSPILWYPEFHTPLYRYLRDKSQHLLLPGIENVPNNSVALLYTNPRFIQSFMVGVNHEFAAELRWREFPTDLQGTYFRKFWDTTIYSVSDNERDDFRTSVTAQNLLKQVQQKFPNGNYSIESIERIFHEPKPNFTAEQLAVADLYEAAIEHWLLSQPKNKDIEPIHQWRKNEPLGSSSDSNQTVILIRGDILEKYPNISLYLAKKIGSDDVVRPDYNQKVFPVFEGNLPPDMTFVGFPISEAQRGEYFFVFQEPIADLRYGLDELDSTPENTGEDALESNLSWQHFDLADDHYPNEKKPGYDSKANAKWGNPAYIASVFTQKSVRVSIPLTQFIQP